MTTRITSQDTSKKHFYWAIKVGAEENQVQSSKSDEEETNGRRETLKTHAVSLSTPRKKKLPSASSISIAMLRSVVSDFQRSRSGQLFDLGSRVVDTLLGYHRGHVCFALQREPNSPLAFLVELSMPISGLVQEMASGSVRIALEYDKHREGDRNVRLLEEIVWRTYCNGKKCRFATRRDVRANERSILKSVEPISMGAGVLPVTEAEGDVLMYMRATFERIMGLRDSEAFYMMNPNSNDAPELSVYLLIV